MMQLLRDAKRRIAMLVARATLAAVNDGLKLQGLQLRLMADEVKDGVERFQNYGFTAHPHAGAEALVLFLGGNRDHGVAVAVDDRRYRLAGLQPGEVAVYSDEDQEEGGHRILFKRGRIIEIRCAELRIDASTSVVINSPSIEHNP